MLYCHRGGGYNVGNSPLTKGALAWGTPPLWLGVSPLPPCQNVIKGGIIPSIAQRKFSGKIDPPSKKVPHI